MSFVQNIKLINAFKILKNQFQDIVQQKKKNYASLTSVKNVLDINNLFQEGCSTPPPRGLVLGVYSDDVNKKENGTLTKMGWKYNIEKTQNNLFEVLKLSGPIPEPGEVRLFFAVETDESPAYPAVAVVGLGRRCLGYCSHEQIDEQKETIRGSVAKGCIKLQQLQCKRIDIDPCDHTESAAEGAALGIWAYQELKNPKKRLEIPFVDLYTLVNVDCDFDSWKLGIQKAGAQNLTRQLQETPANLLTPTVFAQNVVEILCKSGVNVEVKVEGWAENQRMSGFLAVGKASCEAPIFLELSYHGAHCDERPIVLIGQGVTYDSGGLNKKTEKELKLMRGDMTGAACVVASMRAIANMRLPINIRGLIPLVENVIGCNSFRPGDSVKCMNGKSIEIERTDYEATLVLADALLYAQNFSPKYIIDISTPSYPMKQVLDEAACGIFTNSELLWKQIVNASMHTGDRVWRFPLWNYYGENIKNAKNSHADVINYRSIKWGCPCTAAAILREFVPCGQWMHIDATSVMLSNGKDFDYIREGMAGRPTRTLVEFLAQNICFDK